jgi:hypothetical protein
LLVEQLNKLPLLSRHSQPGANARCKKNRGHTEFPQGTPSHNSLFCKITIQNLRRPVLLVRLARSQAAPQPPWPVLIDPTHAVSSLQKRYSSHTCRPRTDSGFPLLQLSHREINLMRIAPPITEWRACLWQMAGRDMGMKPPWTERRTPPRAQRRLLFNATAGCGSRSGSERQQWQVCSAPV